MRAARWLIVLSFLGCFVFSEWASAETVEDGWAAQSRGDFANAMRLLRPLAENGDAPAQYAVGLMYDLGEGTPQYSQAAYYWFRRAAAQGYAPALYTVGEIYADGDGVPKDYVQAYELLTLALERIGKTDFAHQEKTMRKRANLVSKMNADQIATAERLTRDWMPNTIPAWPTWCSVDLASPDGGTVLVQAGALEPDEPLIRRFIWRPPAKTPSMELWIGYSGDARLNFAGSTRSRLRIRIDGPSINDDTVAIVHARGGASWRLAGDELQYGADESGHPAADVTFVTNDHLMSETPPDPMDLVQAIRDGQQITVTVERHGYKVLDDAFDLSDFTARDMLFEKAETMIEASSSGVCIDRPPGMGR